ncbi:UDP-glucose 4-epimerase GalE [Acidiluteibacter ferrifornacis]|uniref:UDP-glucose 4-epimerase n=1 Tax=Acidiluteibacter ferrifornacis TaxID=2692424 RepID=A0A6N9NQL1_9FLAO|nr:UDP-glucose 4-epimerase GalE [Acidiluteibacter ferrifornacis]NBG67367.1 UDP-glucose 4-epimerase GalE [Acidiluteibacter ferrifornacis]
MNNYSNRPKIVVTGGAGFIGSHTVVELWNVGYEPIIIDNFSNSQPWILDRIKQLTTNDIQCYDLDCANQVAMEDLFSQLGQVIGIIHFAAYKSVSESVAHPEKYYANNMGSLQTIINIKEKFNIPDLVFSSSATVYGVADHLPVTEDCDLKPASSPYGETKQLGEQLIKDQLETGAIILRYFNPIGAHPSGLLGELPSGVPQNLVPFITQTAIGDRDHLQVFGTDYETKDGTCVRDYIHVVDLAKAHVAALSRLLSTRRTDVYNIGTGKGNSVREVIETFEKVSGEQLPVKYVDRRPGDIESIYADCGKAALALHWNATYTLEDALMHAWQWEQSLKIEKSNAA